MDSFCNYNAISLFSGAGGMDVGFNEAGVRALIANDNDHSACESYRLNHMAEMLEGDLQHYFDELKKYKGIDFIFGGPPCQGFSVAGKMDPNDSRNELIGLFANVVNVLHPKAFVCENVKALATLRKWGYVRDALINSLNKNYNTALIVLNSKHFGVAQNRERMFLFGFHKDLKKIDSSELSSSLNYKLKSHEAIPSSIRQIVQSLGRAGFPKNSRTCPAKITFAKYPILRRSPYAGMLFNGAGRPLPSDGVSATLAASMGGNKTPIVDEGAIFENKQDYVHKYHGYLLSGKSPYTGTAPERLRRMTIDECLAIQTFPTGYKLYGPQSAIYRQIGNAVPCNLAKAVAASSVSLLHEF